MRVKTAQELFEYARKNPGKLRAAGTGVGTMDDLTLRFLASEGVKITLVSYSKPAERYAAVLGEHNEVLVEQAGDVAQYIDAGQLRPLVAFTSERVGRFPEVPTAKELGFGINHELWLTLVARAGTPKDRVKYLAKKFEQVVKTDQFKKFAAAQLFHEKSLMTGDALRPWVQQEFGKISKLLDEFGLKKK